MNIKEFENKISGCTDCGLCQNRSQIVSGRGNKDADVFLVGEGPGKREDRQGKPFVGKSGKLLDIMLEDAGMEDNVYISNLVFCRPPNNRNPKREEINECLPFTMKQIDIIDPYCLVAVGKFAANKLTEGSERPLKTLLDEYHLNYKYDASKAVIPIYHPAYILRQGKDMDLIKDMVDRLKTAKGMPI